MSILETAMQPEIMDKAWNLLKTEHTPWSVTVDRELLQRHLMRHLLQCREEVLSGSYQPEPLRQFVVPKPDGKQRVISAQYLKDKLVQRALLIVLEPNAEAIFHHDSYAYRRGRSVKMALDKTRERIRLGQDWLVDADISKFFDNHQDFRILILLVDIVQSKHHHRCLVCSGIGGKPLWNCQSIDDFSVFSQTAVVSFDI